MRPLAVTRQGQHLGVIADMVAIELKTLNDNVENMSEAIESSPAVMTLPTKIKAQIAAVTLRARTIRTPEEMVAFWGHTETVKVGDGSNTLLSLRPRNRHKPLLALGEQLQALSAQPGHPNIRTMRVSYNKGMQDQARLMQREGLESIDKVCDGMVAFIQQFPKLLGDRKAENRLIKQVQTRVDTLTDLQAWFTAVRQLPEQNQLAPLQAMTQNLLARTEESEELFKIRSAFAPAADEALERMQPALDKLHQEAVMTHLATLTRARLEKTQKDMEQER
jgi:hypothetical protein